MHSPKPVFEGNRGIFTTHKKEFPVTLLEKGFSSFSKTPGVICNPWGFFRPQKPSKVLANLKKL
jgi:hypothetical protein